MTNFYIFREFLFFVFNITYCLGILLRLIRFERFHSGGNGGQNVNKVETGVRLILSEITVTYTIERSPLTNKGDIQNNLYAMLQQGKGRKQQTGSF